MPQNKNKDACFVGFGSLGKSVANLLKFSSNFKLLKFDDNLTNLNTRNAFSFEDFQKETFMNNNFYLGIGYKNFDTKSKILDRLRILKRSLPHFIHKSAHFDVSAKIGKGCYIFPMSNIDRNVILKDGVLINNSVIISHDSIIGEGSYISPGVIVSGNVSIGKYTFIGSGAVIRDGISIGDNCIVGMNSSVQFDIPSESNVIGNPLKFLKKKLLL